MKIKVLYFASMRDLFGCAGESMELSPGSGLPELKQLLLQKAPGLQGHLSSLAWGVNFEFAQGSARLQDGDEVALLPPVSGGAR
jgi:molybdopterin converting factor subunit 1